MGKQRSQSWAKLAADWGILRGRLPCSRRLRARSRYFALLSFCVCDRFLLTSFAGAEAFGLVPRKNHWVVGTKTFRPLPFRIQCMPLALVAASNGLTVRAIWWGFLEAADAFGPSGSRIECAKKRRGRYPTAMLPRAKNSPGRMVSGSNYRVLEILAVRATETDPRFKDASSAYLQQRPGDI